MLLAFFQVNWGFSIYKKNIYKQQKLFIVIVCNHRLQTDVSLQTRQTIFTFKNLSPSLSFERLSFGFNLLKL